MSTAAQLTAEPVWLQIKQHYEQIGKKLNINQLMKDDPKRFEKFRYVITTILGIIFIIR